MPATPEFKAQLRLAFDSLRVGESFTFRRTFTDGDVSGFCGVTGDFNPYHTDEEFARQSWYGRRTVPGLLAASMMTHIGGLLGFLAVDMHFDFIDAVYVGDTIACTVTFTEKDEAKRRFAGEAEFVNQHGTLVLRARFTGFPGQIRLGR